MRNSALMLVEHFFEYFKIDFNIAGNSTKTNIQKIIFSDLICEMHGLIPNLGGHSINRYIKLGNSPCKLCREAKSFSIYVAPNNIDLENRRIKTRNEISKHMAIHNVRGDIEFAEGSASNQKAFIKNGFCKNCRYSFSNNSGALYRAMKYNKSFCSLCNGNSFPENKLRLSLGDRLISQHTYGAISAETIITYLCFFCGHPKDGKAYRAMPDLETACKRCNSGVGPSPSYRITHLKEIASARGGHVQVSDPTQSFSAHQKVIWQCGVSWHRPWPATVNSVRRGTWCPTCNMKLGEQSTLLICKSIFGDAIPQFCLKDGCSYPYDVFIPENALFPRGILVEYDGDQHDDPDHFFRSRKENSRQEETDRKKDQLAHEKNIPLIRIKKNLKCFKSVNERVENILKQIKFNLLKICPMAENLFSRFIIDENFLKRIYIQDAERQLEKKEGFFAFCKNADIEIISEFIALEVELFVRCKHIPEPRRRKPADIMASQGLYCCNYANNSGPTTAIKVIAILSRKGYLLDFESTNGGHAFSPRNATTPFGIRCFCGKIRIPPKIVSPNLNSFPVKTGNPSRYRICHCMMGLSDLDYETYYADNSWEDSWQLAKKMSSKFPADIRLEKIG